MIFLSAYQTRNLLEAREAGKTRAMVSLDLGLSLVEINLEKDGALLSNGQLLHWDKIETIQEEPTACFLVEGRTKKKIQRFSKKFGRVYSLFPTKGAPALLLSGFPMHRIKGVNPDQGTSLVFNAIGQVAGIILDTATGLSYTAIEASKTAEKVITVELDPSVLEICRLNPWSQTLFDNPIIEQQIGDVFEVIKQFPSDTFNGIIHDPPTFSLAGQLYSGAFYRQLHRVLKKKGRLYHYVGDLNSKSGCGTGRGVKRRLIEAGFKQVIAKPETIWFRRPKIGKFGLFYPNQNQNERGHRFWHGNTRLL